MVSRISTLVGIPSEQAEAMQVAFYDPGQSYAAHYDAFEPAHGGPEAAGGVERFGNRLVSALGYLTEHRAGTGGETEFTRLGLLVQPQVGRLLVFSNIDSAGSRFARVCSRLLSVCRWLLRLCLFTTRGRASTR